jgi:hypothetical protein
MGDTVDVFYNPDNPSEAVLAGDIRSVLVLVAFGVAGLFLLSLGIFTATQVKPEPPKPPAPVWHGR